MNATEQLTEMSIRQAKLKNGLDAAGIGHDLCARFSLDADKAAKFVGSVSRSIFGQLNYNLMNNVPIGVMSRLDDTAKHAILAGTVHAIGKFLEWDITDAILFAADVCEDVNAHAEAAKIREMARQTN